MFHGVFLKTRPFAFFSEFAEYSGQFDGEIITLITHTLSINPGEDLSILFFV